MTTLDRLATSNFRCEEKNEKPVWTLLPDTATILTYHCWKATGHFRGRSYTAWFTMEIPVSEGPWKLCGLPGLIIKAEDDRDIIHLNVQVSSNSVDRNHFFSMEKVLNPSVVEI